MAYRRKQGNPRSSTFQDFRPPEEPSSAADAPSSLAEQAIRASSAHRDSSLSFAYGESAFSPARRRSSPPVARPNANAFDYSSMNKLEEPRSGFWGVLARKAKSIVEEDHAARQLGTSNKKPPQSLDRTADFQYHPSDRSSESHGKNENPAIQKRLDAITSSINYIGGRVGNVLEEGLSAVENRTANIIQETRKLNIRRKTSSSNVQTQMAEAPGFPQMQMDYETQIKASRDVANAMAAKAKLLMRELKTIKADLAFAKERCSQLEEENRVLRESRDSGDHPEDDDLVRLQLETLLAEKARLANENSTFARENRFLREIVEYHQLTMQDVVYLNEGIEEVTEVYQIPTTLSVASSRSPSPGVHAPSELQPDEQPSMNPEEFHPPAIADSLPTSQGAVSVVVSETADSAITSR